MEFILAPSGSYKMGGDPVAEQADENENPIHKVTFDEGFYVGRFTVTQAQWLAIMEDNPCHFSGPDYPVEMISHHDAISFIEKLNRHENTEVYRLPTEAQWEYAARAGSQSTYCYGAERSKLSEYAWFQKNSGGTTHPVGQLEPNAWGLYDMHGNVHEWCSDWFDRNYYAASPVKSPEGPQKGLARALRGGDWGSEDWYCRCAIRSLSSPDRRSPRVGFRVVKMLDAED